MTHQKRTLTDYEEDLQEFLKNPKNKKLYDFYGHQLEVAYSMHQLRKQKKMSQQVLAKKLGTTQSNVARMEAGNQNFSLKTLGNLAAVFGKRLEVSFK